MPEFIKIRCFYPFNIVNSILAPISTRSIFTSPGESFVAAAYKRKGIASINIRNADLSHVVYFLKKLFIGLFSFETITK